MPRREPVERDRYRAAARTAGIARRTRLLALDSALVAVLVLTAFVALPRVEAGVGTGVDQLLASVQSAIPLPQPDATVDAANVVVRGTTEVGATLTINGRSVIVLPDGSFRDSTNASAGPLVITVVARDRAGNETTEKLNVVAQPLTQAGGLTLTVAMSSTSVRPGQGVFATITLRGANGPRAGRPRPLSLAAVSM